MTIEIRELIRECLQEREGEVFAAIKQLIDDCIEEKMTIEELANAAMPNSEDLEYMIEKEFIDMYDIRD